MEIKIIIIETSIIQWIDRTIKSKTTQVPTEISHPPLLLS